MHFLLPLFAMHTVVLSTITTNTICTSLEMVRLAETSTRHLVEFSCFAWTLLTLNAILFYANLACYNNEPKERESKHFDASQAYLLNDDDEVFDHFPVDLKNQQCMEWIDANKANIQTLLDINRLIAPMYTQLECENLLASMHRDLISNDRQ